VLAAGAEPVFVPARAETNFLPDFASLSASVLERTVAAYICSPSNPEGACAGEPYWRTLFALAERFDFTVFADECYADIYFDKQPLSALTARFSETRGIDRLLTFHSLSKRSCLPGLRSGIVAGDAKLIAKFRALRTVAGPQMPMPILAASAAAWRDETHVAATGPDFVSPRGDSSCGSTWAMARRPRSDFGSRQASASCPAPIWAAKRNRGKSSQTPGFASSGWRLFMIYQPLRPHSVGWVKS
jgi:hypothetical protein